MVFYGLIKYWYASNNWRHDVVPAVRCIRSFCEQKLIHSHPNNYTHLFFQPNYKRIMAIPMNVKEFDNFFSSITPFFVQISSKIVNFVFSSKTLDFAISSVFRPKRISCVPTYCPCRVFQHQEKQMICKNTNFKSVETAWNNSHVHIRWPTVVYAGHSFMPW